jgi:hypothetical protein
MLFECAAGAGNRITTEECEGALALGPVGYAFDGGNAGRVELWSCRAGDADWFVSERPDCEGHHVERRLGWASPRHAASP